MLHRILVPLDGSPFAEAALPYAEALARRTGATIHLVRASLVRHPPQDNTEEARIVARERAYLVEQAKRLGAERRSVTVTLQQAAPTDASGSSPPSTTRPRAAANDRRDAVGAVGIGEAKGAAGRRRRVPPL